MQQQHGAKALIVNDNEEILLLKQSFKGREYWTLPGGRIEDGESIEETLDRECREEINVGVTTVGEKIGETQFSYIGENDEEISVTVSVFDCTVESYDFSIGMPDDIATIHTYKWVPREEIHTYDTDNLSSILDTY